LSIRDRVSIPQLLKRISRTAVTESAVFVGLTLLLGGVFKLSAFAREAFITSKFGFVSATDSYFALQQMPLTVAAFMFGPFARAFTPAYTRAFKSDGWVEWFPGLIIYGSLIGVALTGLSVGFAPFILDALTRAGSSATLVILSVCYAPIIFIGFRAATWTSYGKNLSSMTLSGLPYLLMTILLVGIYLIGWLGNLSLPLSMTAGFSLIGVVSLLSVLLKERPFRNAGNWLLPWRYRAFREFINQLTASSLETCGYSISQFVLLYYMARAGEGVISANNCATRIGLLGYSVLVLPLLQLMQARMCKSSEEGKGGLAARYTLGMAVGTMLFAAGVFLFRHEIVALIYGRGKVTADALAQVALILPAWLSYFVVMSLNSSISLYMFHASIGYRFTRNMLAGYLVANVLRVAIGHTWGASWIVWCAVISEACAFIVNMLTSARQGRALAVGLSAARTEYPA
jgi:O-antigen/teichoic acid export membrane protein